MPSLPRSLRAPRPRVRRVLSPLLESLESHLVPAGAGLAGSAIPAVIMQPLIQVEAAPVGADSGPGQIAGEETPWGMSPQQIGTAYAFPGITPAAGTGQTIAIVDAYDDPDLLDSSAADFASSDLAQFDQEYGLPSPPSFEKLNEQGGAAGLPGTDPVGAGTAGNWEEEEALDVEWTHAMAPGASIILVECNSSSSADLYQGAMTAASLPGVSVISMSWGCAEFNGETSFDGDFTTPAGHQGVTFVASTGDDGSPGMYPAYSPNVVAVGGTSLTTLGDDAYGGETAWPDGGGGTSTIEPEPAFQGGAQGSGMRTIPDISFDADPNTGVSVYDSYNDTSGQGPWEKIGGTSLGAPCWSALIATADQERVAEGGTTLDGPTQTLPALYSLADGDFHDITAGSNGAFSAGPGYDEVTGLGTPVADLVVSGLASYDIAPQLAMTADPPAVVTAGEPFAMTVEVETPGGSLDAGYLGTVTIRLASNPGGDTLGGTLTATADDGFAVFSGLTLTDAAAGYTILATTEGPAVATTTPFTVTASTPDQLVIVASPTGTTTGLTVSVEDPFGNVVTTFSGSVTVQGSGDTGHGRTAARRTNLISTTASQGVATFTRVKLGPKGRSYALQVAADGLDATTVINLESKPAVAKSRKDAVRVARTSARPAFHHAAR
jgi:subtilase family serine protease